MCWALGILGQGTDVLTYACRVSVGRGLFEGGLNLGGLNPEGAVIFQGITQNSTSLHHITEPLLQGGQTFGALVSHSRRKSILLDRSVTMLL
jgi:hypothetical protein